MDRKTILEIVDDAAGGIKGLELMTKIIMRLGSEAVNPQTCFEQIETLVRTEVPELAVLRYGHQISDDTLREKIFVYRRELTPQKV